MDHPPPVLSGHANASWPRRRTMDYDDGPSRSARWVLSASSTSRHSPFTSRMPPSSQVVAGPLSPISTGIDIPAATLADTESYTFTAPSSFSSAPALDTSTSSSSPTPENSTSPFSHASHSYSTNDLADSDAGVESPLGNINDMQWETTETEHVQIPKLEPTEEDDFRLEDLKEAPVNPETQANHEIPKSKPKRPRGRPRKLAAIPPSTSPGKLNKGRSKTGCITCRKRKKKCDETKPRCMNCEKNAVICEGYPEKHIWRSGKERAEEELLRNQSLPVITMQPIFTGLETAEDRIFWKHYNDTLSAVFTVEGEHRNAFRDKLVPLATKHKGMMHSILSLASRHLNYDTPYGAKILQRSNKVTIEALRNRGNYHKITASKIFAESMQTLSDHTAMVDAAHYGQMLCLILEDFASGQGYAEGGPRLHYEAFPYLIAKYPPEDADFYAFIIEIFFYHIFADDVLSFPGCKRRLTAGNDWTPPTSINSPRLIGVADGLFNLITEITSIRLRICERIENNADPRIDYDSLYRASEIESSLHDWSPEWPAGDSRERAALLYKQMTWLYLKMTICPPLDSDPASTILARTGTALASTPPRSVTASRASSPSSKLHTPMLSDEDRMRNPRRHSISNPNTLCNTYAFPPPLRGAQAQSSSNGESRASPPPIRRPSNLESGVTRAVEECLTLLESFKPSDPAQTLLLLPCVLVGTACSGPNEQDRIRRAIHTIHGYTGLKNTDRALKVLEEVWRLMNVSELLAWDWPRVANRLQIDYLF